jgi:hypothetical protein
MNMLSFISFYTLHRGLVTRQAKLFVIVIFTVMLYCHMVIADGFQPISVICEVNGFAIPAIIDTGAEISVMSASCARRCGLHGLVDPQHSGKAIGVGTSDIIGGIEGLNLRIGPLAFKNKVSILRDSRCDFLIGLDILERFKCAIHLREKLLRLYVGNEEIRISLTSNGIVQRSSVFGPAEARSDPCREELLSPIGSSSSDSTDTNEDFEEGYSDEFETSYESWDRNISMEGV